MKNRYVHKNFRRLVPCVILLTTGFPGVSRADAEDDQVQGGQSTPACFYIRQASDFHVLDRNNFIVYAPTKSRAYHVRISPPSTELRFANGLAFEGRSNRICGHAGETVAFRSREARRYSITNVWRLDEAALEQLLDNKKLAEGIPSIEPEAVEGAEIERDLSDDDE